MRRLGAGRRHLPCSSPGKAESEHQEAKEEAMQQNVPLTWTAAWLSGEITSKDTLVIGERAVVRATVRTATLVVRGEVVGNVTASEQVVLEASARVTGDVEAPVIVMAKGAVLDGHCRMTKAKPAEAPHGVVIPIKG